MKVESTRQPNVIFVFADQLRRQSVGFGGDENILTPHLDSLQQQSLDFEFAISGMPVCCPARASLMTGLYAHHHGVVVNDVQLDDSLTTIGKEVAKAGYTTAYIGKWHLHGNGRKEPVPRESRGGFEYWRALECTHDYNHSEYYAGDSNEKQVWHGYDATQQTTDAVRFIEKSADEDQPFFLMLSWGPPHDPYDTAPEKYKKRVDPEALKLSPNVPEGQEAIAREELAGYYAHILALDAEVGRLMDAVKAGGIEDDTIFVFWSDHGDMLHSQGEVRKQRPWDESIRVPFLIRYPREFGRSGQPIGVPINTPDIMPTLLGLLNQPVPDSIDGIDYSAFLRGKAPAPASSALLACLVPCGEYSRRKGGREYRGLRTTRYTYVEDLNGPWLMYDNRKDPNQMENLIDDKIHKSLVNELSDRLDRLLKSVSDDFSKAADYINRFSLEVDEDETMPVRDYL